MPTDLVSVIIPCYNAAPYISETIDSILSQTYTNWECIIVDDHSTDDSVEIIQQYCINYPLKIKRYTNPRKGACAARNYGFEKSNGDFIQYLDADDLISTNKLELQLKIYSQFGNTIITYCRWGRFYKSISNVSWVKQTIDKNYDNPIDWLIDIWNGKGMVAQHAWLTPRHIIEKVGKWDESLLINQDGEFFCRVLLNAREIKFCKEAEVYYRSGISESVSNINRDSREKAESLLQSHLSYLQQVNPFIHEKKVQKAIEQLWGSFFYRFWHLYPDLCAHAENILREQNLKPGKSVGGKGFQLLTQLLGLKKALTFKYLLSKK